MSMYSWQNGLRAGRELLILFAIEREYTWTFERLMIKTILLKLSNLFIMN